jgi:hypothetical protein
MDSSGRAPRRLPGLASWLGWTLLLTIIQLAVHPPQRLAGETSGSTPLPPPCPWAHHRTEWVFSGEVAACYQCQGRRFAVYSCLARDGVAVSLPDGTWRCLSNPQHVFACRICPICRGLGRAQSHGWWQCDRCGRPFAVSRCTSCEAFATMPRGGTIWRCELARHASG